MLLKLFPQKVQKPTIKIDNDKLIRFFRNEDTDTEGRTLEDILLFSDDEIEHCHNFIQWIFPTQERSQYNEEAPIIDSGFERLFQVDDKAKSGYCKSCKKYLNYIGFECNDGITPIQNHPLFYDRPLHNQLRITRMLYSLNQVGNKQCSINLYNAIMRIIKEDAKCCIGKSTIRYWETTQEYLQQDDSGNI